MPSRLDWATISFLVIAGSTSSTASSSFFLLISGTSVLAGSLHYPLYAGPEINFNLVIHHLASCNRAARRPEARRRCRVRESSTAEVGPPLWEAHVPLGPGRVYAR